jgi:hypothetical protein
MNEAPRGLLLGLAFVMVVVLAGWQTYEKIETLKESAVTRRDMAEKRLRSSRKTVNRKEALEKALRQTASVRADNETKLIKGKTAPLAAASLQESVKSIILQTGGRISSERVAPTRALEPFQVITVSFDFILPNVGALRDILYAVESRTPFLTVPELTAQVRNVRNPGELTVKMNISALWRAPSA